MTPPEYAILWSAEALKMLRALRDKRTQRAIVKRASALAVTPDSQGQPLRDELASYRSVRAASQRCRIVYRTDHAKGAVLVVAVGLRRTGKRDDVYALASRLRRLGLDTLDAS